MRKFTLVVFLMGVMLAGFSQKKSFRERTLEEIRCFVDYPLVLLGRTEKEIRKGGRPYEIKGGDIWEVEVFKKSNAIVIGTGCGALLLNISDSSKRVFIVTFLAHKKAKLDSAAIREALKDKYSFDEKGFCEYTAVDSRKMILILLNPGIILVALEDIDKVRNIN